MNPIAPTPQWLPLQTVARETGISAYLIKAAAQRGELPLRLLSVGLSGDSGRARTYVDRRSYDAWRSAGGTTP